MVKKQIQTFCVITYLQASIPLFTTYKIHSTDMPLLVYTQRFNFNVLKPQLVIKVSLLFWKKEVYFYAITSGAIYS